MLVGFLGGCSGRIPGVYRIDIQQGNVLTQSQLAQLEHGMEKRKVQFVLGSPLITDAFNPNRWDYYYSYEQGNGARVQRIVSVHFEDDRLVRVSGDVKASHGQITVLPRRDELVKVPEGLVDDGLLAALTPGFLTDRPRFIEPREKAPDNNPPTTAANEPAPESATPEAAATVQLSAEERQRVAATLAGFGRREQPTGDTQAGVTPSDGEEDTTQQGVLARIARRLGLSGEQGQSTTRALANANDPTSGN